MRSGIWIPGLVLVLACSPRPDVEGPRMPEAASPAMAAIDVCGALLTDDLQSPHPPAILPPDQPVRVVAFGDFGNGSSNQKRVARAMAEHDRTQPFDFGITLGDNFYRKGLSSPDHPRWRTDWEDLYEGLAIRFYATFGNHDYKDLKSPGAEIERSRTSRSWCLPRPYYTFTAGPVQFFALDTVPVDQRSLDGKGPTRASEQRVWLERALASSRATWKVVYGHHPVYTNGEHGEDLGELPAVKGYLLPLIRNQADVYIAGHDHDLQALKPDGGVTFFISGGGGKERRPLRTSRCRAWAESTYGFAVLEATREEMTVRFFGADGRSLYETSWTKGSPPPDCPRP
jgi:tartrate-resistant acid phosphatase type 5